MSELLDALLTDLDAEGRHLESLLVGLSDDGWRAQTPAAGWDVATTVAHLAWTDEAALLAATDKPGWDALVVEALADPDHFVDRGALTGGLAAFPVILERWRTSRVLLAQALRSLPEGERMPWYGPPMSAASMATARMMETWAHGLDVHDALGLAVEPTDRLRHVAHLGVRTRDFAFAVRELAPPTEEFRVSLTAPSGERWSWGPEGAAQTVTGPAYDFCRLVTQRINRVDTALVAVGPDADAWLSIAQCFAGPSGPGRGPR